MQYLIIFLKRVYMRFCVPETVLIAKIGLDVTRDEGIFCVFFEISKNISFNDR